MHMGTIFGCLMVLKIIVLPCGRFVPVLDQAVVDLLNALAMVILLHVFLLRMLHPLLPLHLLKHVVQRVSLAKVKKIAVKRSARRESAKNKILCWLGWYF